jgi:hypothetical protein
LSRSPGKKKGKKVIDEYIYIFLGEVVCGCFPRDGYRQLYTDGERRAFKKRMETNTFEEKKMIEKLCWLFVTCSTRRKAKTGPSGEGKTNTGAV